MMTGRCAHPYSVVCVGVLALRVSLYDTNQVFSYFSRLRGSHHAVQFFFFFFFSACVFLHKLLVQQKETACYCRPNLENISDTNVYLGF
jgi:hypothetical protein